MSSPQDVNRFDGFQEETIGSGDDDDDEEQVEMSESAAEMMKVNSCFLSFLSESQRVAGVSTRRLIATLEGRAEVLSQTGGQRTITQRQD